MPLQNDKVIIAREPASQVKLVGSAVIQDNGVLTPTMRASNGCYLFSEVGAGVKPLVILGHKLNVYAYLLANDEQEIENRIEDLPGIYLSVEPYKPGARFVGLFPLHDAVKALVQGAAAFAPGSELTDLVGAVKDIKESVEFTQGKWSATTTSKAPPAKVGEIYVRLHYLQATGAVKIAEKKVSFRFIYEALKRALGD